MYRQFFLKALGPVLGFERAKSAGEDWDQVLDVFEAERERRYGPMAKERIDRLTAAKRIPPTSQADWDAFRQRFKESTRGGGLPPTTRGS